MKFGQLIEHPKRNIFLSKLCRKWGRETSSRLLLVLKKDLYKHGGNPRPPPSGGGGGEGVHNFLLEKRGKPEKGGLM